MNELDEENMCENYTNIYLFNILKIIICILFIFLKINLYTFKGDSDKLKDRFHLQRYFFFYHLK